MDTWEEHSADFKNESDVEEELDADGTSLEKAEEEHFAGD